MAELHRSLFGRLFLIFLATIAVYAVIVVAVLSELIQEHPRNQFSRRLLASLVERLGEPPAPAAMLRMAEDLKVSLLVTGPDLTWRSDDRLPPLDQLLAAAPKGRDFGLENIDGKRVAMLHAHRRTWFVTGFTEPLSGWARTVLAGGVAALLLVAWLNYRAVRWLFGPIRDVHRAAETIAGGDLSHRIAVTRSDEIGTLTESVNAMAERIQAMLEAKRQLLLAISHEIRSPLARARVAAEMTPEGKPRERLTAALDDINRLVGALLQAEASDGRKEAVDLRALARAAAEDPRIVLDLPETPATAEVDPVRVGLLIGNLLANALRYGGDGPVRLAVERRGEGCAVTVSDHGPGIAPEYLPHLGEPFFRPDGSRSRATGGHGLGLYICRQIAQSHGGRLEIDSAPGRGTAVTAVFPPAAR